jgi:hypothetical protein
MQISISMSLEPAANIAYTLLICSLRSVPKGFHMSMVIGLTMKYGMVLRVIVIFLFKKNYFQNLTDLGH